MVSPPLYLTRRTITYVDTCREDGLAIRLPYSSSNKSVFNVVDGQAVVTPHPKKDTTVTLTVRVVSDRIFANGYYNYGTVDVTRSFAFIVPAGD
jgi:hypothetical protein